MVTLRALRRCGVVCIACGFWVEPAAHDPAWERARDSAEAIRFAVIGDFGTGNRRQMETAATLWKQHGRFPYDFVITVGDNLYGSQRPQDFDRKFALPYKPLIDSGISFHAALGNHDEPIQVNYPPFNMQGRRYYTFVKGEVQFFSLDSTAMTHAQLRWIEDTLAASTAAWRIAYFHHPIYSSGRRHGPTLVLQSALQPIFSTHGVQVIFVGHEHFYERLAPRYGIHQFTTGSAGQLRPGNLRKGSFETVKGYDEDNSFMLIAIEGDVLRFEAVSRTGVVVDSGVLRRMRGR